MDKRKPEAQIAGRLPDAAMQPIERADPLDDAITELYEIAALISAVSSIAGEIHATGTGPCNCLEDDSLHAFKLLRAAYNRIEPLVAVIGGIADDRSGEARHA